MAGLLWRDWRIIIKDDRFFRKSRKDKIHEKTKYIEVDELLYPDLELSDQKEVHLSKYGRMKLNYLKEYQKGLHFELQATNQLYDYLQIIDKEANEMYEQLLIDFKKKRNITEELKENDQMKWVQEMNNIQNCIEKIIRKEVIEG